MFCYNKKCTYTSTQNNCNIEQKQTSIQVLYPGAAPTLSGYTNDERILNIRNFYHKLKWDNTRTLIYVLYI